MILQLQQQILNQRNQQNAYQQQQQNPQYQYQQMMNQNGRGTGNMNRQQLPVISPAELMNRNMQHPITQIRSEINTSMNGTPKLSAMDIFNNKELMNEVNKNPRAKRKLLEKLLNDHRHVMTASQIGRISQILDTLPPLDNNAMDTEYASVDFGSLGGNNMMGSGGGGNGGQGGRGFNHGTTSQNPYDRQLQTTKQLNTIDSLTKHYKTEAEAEEAQFKMEEEKRRQMFYERQRQRKQEYEMKLKDIDASNIDALKLFQLPKNYDLEQLKMAYKKLALKSHPDKPGGNQEQFQLVTKCYMSLLEKYKNREEERPFDELRKGSSDYIRQQGGNSRGGNGKTSGGNGGSGHMDKDKFDLKMFNKIYEENKLWESNDDGYGDWFKSSETEDAPELFGNKFNLNVFNSTFENHKERLTSQSGAIQEYRDPTELVSCSTGFTEIDIYAKKVEDFSKPLPVGGAGGKRDLAFTDLKTAYTGRGAFIDPNKVEYKTYKNVDELEKARSKIRFDMNDEERQQYEMKKRQQDYEEERRQEIIRQRDNMISSTYEKTHERMLGYRAQPDLPAIKYK